LNEKLLNYEFKKKIYLLKALIFNALEDGAGLLIQRYFCTGYDYGEKQILARAIEIQKENCQ